ncbi:MAG: hypothetical protein ACYCVL_00140 [Gemmatimonadaceae bacterium]
MRPTARPQSALRSPLNQILGTEANVRVLRAIFLSDIPIGVSELARVTALQLSGVARVCVKLEDLGVIETVGRGARNRQYRRAGRFALANALSTVFLEERNRANHIFADIRQAVQTVHPHIRAAWIEGPVATGTDRPENAVDVAVLADSASVEFVRTELWKLLLGVQQQWDVSVELHVRSLADLKTAPPVDRDRWTNVILLFGPSPLDLLHTGSDSSPIPPRPTSRGHALRDEQAAMLAHAIADRIRRDPSIVEDARQYIARRLADASSGEQLELREWSAILSAMSIARLRRFLVENTDRAVRLRQSLPFLDVIPKQERDALMAAASART